MNYADVKKYVLRTSNNLALVPGQVISTLLQKIGGAYDTWEVPGITDGDNLGHITHPRIACILHTQRDDIQYAFSNYRVCTINVDDVPAFFYVGVKHSCTNGNIFILDVAMTEAFLQILLLMQLDKITANAKTDITETTELEQLTELYDVDIEYGVEPNEPRGVYCF
jgi:hypothetical protein